jgi:hypothetical protein
MNAEQGTFWLMLKVGHGRLGLLAPALGSMFHGRILIITPAIPFRSSFATSNFVLPTEFPKLQAEYLYSAFGTIMKPSPIGSTQSS